MLSTCIAAPFKGGQQEQACPLINLLWVSTLYGCSRGASPGTTSGGAGRQARCLLMQNARPVSQERGQAQGEPPAAAAGAAKRPASEERAAPADAPQQPPQKQRRIVPCSVDAPGGPSTGGTFYSCLPGLVHWSAPCSALKCIPMRDHVLCLLQAVRSRCQNLPRAASPPCQCMPRRQELPPLLLLPLLPRARRHRLPRQRLRAALKRRGLGPQWQALLKRTQLQEVRGISLTPLLVSAVQGQHQHVATPGHLC